MRSPLAVVAVLLMLAALYLGWLGRQSADPADPDDVAQMTPDTNENPEAACSSKTNARSGRFTGGGGIVQSEPEPLFLEVVVTDAEWETPIEGATVRLYEPPPKGRWNRNREPLEQAPTDTSGTVRLPVQGNGSYNLTAIADGYGSSSVGGLTVGRTAPTVHLELFPRALVEGSVVDTRNRLIPASVEFRRRPDDEVIAGRIAAVFRSATTRPEGRFRLNLGAGRYTVTASTRWHHERLIKIEVGRQPIRDFTIVLEERDDLVTLSGRVLDHEGNGVVGAKLSLYRQRSDDGLWRQQTRFASGDDGGFSEDFPATPEARLEVEMSGYDRQVRHVSLTRSLDETIVLQPWQIFTVEVVDSDGRQVGGADIIGDSVIDHAQGTQREVAVRRAGGPGSTRYYATGYPFRIYAHDLAGGHGVSNVVMVDEYRPSIRLQLEADGRLRGRVVDPEGKPVTDFDVRLIELAGHEDLMLVKRNFRSDDGTFVLDGLPAGEVGIRVSGAGVGHAEETVQVSPERTAFLEVVLRPERPGGF